jgi:hypothetical protein
MRAPYADADCVAADIFLADADRAAEMFVCQHFWGKRTIVRLPTVARDFVQGKHLFVFFLDTEQGFGARSHYEHERSFDDTSPGCHDILETSIAHRCKNGCSR